MGEYFSRGSLSEIELQTVVPLAGRKYLVSSNSSGFPKHLSGPKEDFPMLLKARKGQEASMKDWALRSREIIDQAYQRYAYVVNMSELKTPLHVLYLWLQSNEYKISLKFRQSYILYCICNFTVKDRGVSSSYINKKYNNTW